MIQWELHFAEVASDAEDFPISKKVKREAQQIQQCIEKVTGKVSILLEQYDIKLKRFLGLLWSDCVLMGTSCCRSSL